MKAALAKISAAPHRRAGTIFQYYMIYLVLTGTVMTTASMCLHAVLKADRADVKVAQYLKTLLRLDTALRLDFQDAQLDSCEPAKVIATTVSGENLKWIISDHVLLRETSDGQKVVSSDRFVFPKDTQLEFHSRNETSLIGLTLTEAPAFSVNGPAADSVLPGKTIEMLIHVGATGSTSSGSEASGSIQGADKPAPESQVERQVNKEAGI